ncbi:DUF3325 family protein [Sphingomonas paeninsulae]|jgi:hypothetical protein|uniref:DUF3325 family protein n=1 Tax=Sphingomonas paeninsulae TaxID=2319844 RepID=A0A494TCI6_SPHPE|nr:DUF3325 family protein [Sphingomonas paeninsulae]AYJ86880.1 DUF3325 family protein [Sphingomonas paeninsulae]
MPVDPGLIAYAALASFAAGRVRHRAAVALPLKMSPSVARIVGTLLLLFSAWVATLRFGAGLGAVAWTGQLCLAGVIFVLLLSWRPRVALLLAVPALLVGFAQ